MVYTWFTMQTATKGKVLTGADIRAARARHGLSQAQAAKRAGWARPVLSHVETGKMELSQESLARLIEQIEEQV